MANYDKAGADAASTYDEAFRQIIANDPDVQAVIRGVWGSTPVDARPSDTPKNLEKANDAASKEISRILAAKGITLPERTFVNPRTGSIEGARGWAGLSGIQKALIVGAAGATGVGALGAMGVLGGGAAAGGSGAAAASAAPAVAGGTGAGLGTAGTAAGIAGATSVGSKIARGVGLAQQGAGIVNQVESLFGRDPQSQAERGAVAGTMANQAAVNRLREAQVAQGGMLSDAQALKNVQRTGQLANYVPPSASSQALFDKYGKRLPGVDANTMGFARDMQSELAKRLAAGEPLTLSGIPRKGAQEIADEQAARQSAERAGQPSVGSVVSGGARIASAIPGFLDTLGAYKRKPVNTGTAPAPPGTRLLGGLQDEGMNW